MTGKLTLTAAVSYRDVDRNELLSLPGVFKFFQEAAIMHANQVDIGTRAMLSRGESWVLNRMAVAIHRYPRYEEKLRIETWSRGIKGFKGYREYRGYDAQEALLFTASSLWLYVNLKTKAIVRVPAEIAAGFPVEADGVFCPGLESLEFAASEETTARIIPITIRYSDVDANQHVNNTAYLDFVQTALAQAGLQPQPRGVRIKFIKGIPADADHVTVRLESQPSGARFCIENGTTLFAQGEITDLPDETR